jgi:hypothetical protein
MKSNRRVNPSRSDLGRTTEDDDGYTAAVSDNGATTEQFQIW